mgnify:CR=1 FL=1
MKLFLKIILTLTLIIPGIYTSYAEDKNQTFTWVTIQTTVDLPWMWCKVNKTKSKNTSEDGWVTVYDCNIKPWFAEIMTLMSWMIKYFTYIAMISAVLFIVINGIMYTMSGVDSWMKDEAKKRITKTLIWIVILLLSGFLLNLFFPWIYT